MDALLRLPPLERHSQKNAYFHMLVAGDAERPQAAALKLKLP
jgi:hypothetical protein